jgi:hypothetical protein
VTKNVSETLPWRSIQNTPDWCRHLYSSCGSAKQRSHQAKQWIPGSTAKSCCDCVKTCEDVAPNFGENTPGCFTVTPLLTIPSSPSSFWRNNGCLPQPTLLPYFLFPKMKLKLIGRRFDTIEEIQPESQSAWDSDRKWLLGSVQKMEETLGPVSTCGRELLRGWWRPIGLMVSFMIFTASVRNILDTPSYRNNFAGSGFLTNRKISY